MEYFGKQEEEKIYLKAQKVMKYNAKVAPDPDPEEKVEHNIHQDEEVYEEEEEMNSEEMDDKFNVLDNHAMKVKPNRKHVNKDPFEICIN